jgi:hypothetical protein
MGDALEEDIGLGHRALEIKSNGILEHLILVEFFVV